MSDLRSLAPPPQGQVIVLGREASDFGVRLSQGGAKTFVLKQDNRRITLGHFPVISLQDARSEAKRLLAEFTLGPPASAKHRVKAAIEEYLAEKARTGARSPSEAIAGSYIGTFASKAA